MRENVCEREKEREEERGKERERECNKRIHFGPTGRTTTKLPEIHHCIAVTNCASADWMNSRNF